MAETETTPGRTAGFEREFIDCWNQVPNKALFFGLFVAWVILFQFLGSSTFAYVDSPSIFGWLYKDYVNPSEDNDDGHGILILIAVPILFWWKRREILAAPARMWGPGLILLAVCLLLHAVGYLIQQPRLSAVAFFCGIYALMGLAWGPRWLRRGFFPFFLLAFAVPLTGVGGPIAAFTFHLRLLVTGLVTFVCNNFLGIEVHRQGTQLYNAANNYSYEVAAACSGLRSVIAILALCTVYGFVSFDRNWKRLLLMASSVPLAVLGNMVRMLSIIIAAEVGGQSEGDFVHGNWFFSLLPYIPAILGVIAVGYWLPQDSPATKLPLKATPV